MSELISLPLSEFTRTMTKWFPSARLETRTKESNICASSRMVKPETRSESDCWDFCTSNRPIDRERFEHEIYVRTRKMVNYACEGQSLRKLRWRLVAILTCKSFVIYRYRGERLIEPSSSWFPPKFPSG